MKERINKLARGIVDINVPRLHMSEQRFEGKLNPDEVARFDFVLTSENGILLKGLVYSENPRVTTLKTAFGGMRSRIGFEVNTRNMSDGEELRGALILVSNAGELQIPYCFTIRAYTSQAIISGLKKAEDLAALFAKDEEKAVRVFDDSDFCNAEFMRTLRYRTIYDALHSCPDRRLACIAFLKAAGMGDRLPMEAKTAVGRGRALKEEKKVSGKPPFLDKLEDKALIEELVGLYIRTGSISEEAFRVYGCAIRQGSEITRLYTYYLYAMPYGYSECLPREVYLYFSYEKEIEEQIKLPLYYNILSNFGPEWETYDRFSHQIQDYAVEALLNGRIDERLALLYDRMILPDMVDERIAEVLPGILRANRITTEDPEMYAVVVCCQELNGETVVPLKNGTAYVPLFMEQEEILFQDAFGNRYTDIAYQKTQVWEKPELLEKCLQILPAHPMLKLGRVREITKTGIRNTDECALLEKILTEMPLKALFAEQITDVIIRYLDTLPENRAFTEADTAFLSAVDHNRLGRESRETLFRIYVCSGAMEDALRILKSKRPLQPEKETLEKLTVMLIHRSAGESDPLTLRLSHQLFRMGTKDPNVIGYLLSFYNGASDEMVKIMERGKKLKLDYRRIIERVLPQMIFSRTEKDLGHVYDEYHHLPGRDTVLSRAYITKCAIDSFLSEKPLPETVYGDLYALVHQEKLKDRVPVIYLLALSRHLTAQQKLSGEEKLELSMILDHLIEKKLVFAYTKEASKFVHIPDYIMNRYYIEYRGDAEVRPTLMLRILPEEQDFEEREFSRVFMNVYVCPVTLFTGEKAEYQIYDYTRGNSCADSGCIAANGKLRLKGDTLDILNEISGLTGKGKDQELYEAMLRYVRNQSVIDALFVADMKEELQ